jgi:hypothetical protein
VLPIDATPAGCTPCVRDVDSVEIEGGSQGRRATHAADVNRELLEFLGCQPASVGVAA